MKIKLIIIILTAGIAHPLHCQNRFYTKTGVITFTAGTALEDIDAINKSVSSIIDISTGQVEVAVLIKGFEFRRGLMQEHFNENYMESEKFPKAIFKGKIDNISKIDFKKDGKYPAIVRGTLEIHGVKKEVEVSVTIAVSAGQLNTSAVFQVSLENYNIKVPGAVKDKISTTVSIQLTGDYVHL